MKSVRPASVTPSFVLLLVIARVPGRAAGEETAREDATSSNVVVPDSQVSRGSTATSG